MILSSIFVYAHIHRVTLHALFIPCIYLFSPSHLIAQAQFFKFCPSIYFIKNHTFDIMRFYSILISALLVLSFGNYSSSYAQSYATAETCSQFKTGTFIYLTPEFEGTIVKRTKNKQTETVGTGRDKKNSPSTSFGQALVIIP